MTSKYILQCLLQHNYCLSLIQLRDLKLHPSIQLLIGTAPAQDTHDAAKIRAGELVQKHLLSGQAIQVGRKSAFINILMDSIFVSQ